MNATKAYATKSFAVIILFMMAIGGAVSAGIYFGLKQVALILTPGSGAAITIPGVNVKLVIQSLADVTRSLDMLIADYLLGIVAAVVVIFLFFGLLLWGVLKIGVSSLFGDLAAMPSKEMKSEADGKDKKKDYADQRLEQERRRRLFLHFMSVLQREGRLLDFFAEELDLYDDEQIGAAVRSIQEDCKKSVEKYLSPVPVIDKDEGEVVEVVSGFDSDAIKLTGNVSGDPPFSGVLRHRGWKASKNELPKLSDARDTSIIAPAEVEIE